MGAAKHTRMSSASGISSTPKARRCPSPSGNVVDSAQDDGYIWCRCIAILDVLRQSARRFQEFDEKTVDEVIKKVFNLTLNVLSFYETYAGEHDVKACALIPPRRRMCSTVIIARLDRLVANGHGRTRRL